MAAAAATSEVDARNDAEWKNPDNWNGSLYFSKTDSRWLVPKQAQWMGWTFNLGNPYGEVALVGALVAVPLIVVAKERGYFQKACEVVVALVSGSKKD